MKQTLEKRYDQIKIRDYKMRDNIDRRVTLPTIFFCILLNRDVYNNFFLLGI